MKSAQTSAIARESRDRTVILGTAGHIDHGKTALVFALTGTDTDRLPEEKTRGITIDLGFASLRLPSPEGGALDISLIDVPGHHAFIRNMLAGTGGIDCVMLVIAADEGIKPQTEEHLAICTLLAISSGLVVITKADAVSAERLEEVRREVARFVEHTFLHHAPVLAVSALTREGIPALKDAIAQFAAAVPERSTQRLARIPLDRVFTVRGFGTVVTGTLHAGRVHAEDSLELQPQARTVRVRGVQVHGKPRAEAHAPNRVALNLAGVDANEVKRGDTLVPQGTLDPVSTVDVELTLVPGAPALKHRSRVRLHAFTSDTLATVLLYDSEPAASGHTGVLARLRLANPIILAPGDRFVIRQPSPALTLGGGYVLDAHPLPRLRKATTRQWLTELRSAAAAEQLLTRVQRRRFAGLTIPGLVRETGFTPDAVRDLLKPVVSDGRLISAAGEHLISLATLDTAVDSIVRELTQAKGAAFTKAALRSGLGFEPWLLDAAVSRLQNSGRVQLKGDTLALAGQSPQAPHLKSAPLAKVEELYRTAGLASPIVSEACAKLGIPAAEMHTLITALLREHKLVRMGSDNLLIHAEALAQLTRELSKHRGETFDVGRFKSFTGLTRKHAIPLLEYLDSIRVTRNANGTRTVLR